MGNFEAYRKIDLKDKTLSQRVETTLEQLSQEPSASISAACKDPHQAKAVYRLTGNEKFTTEALYEISREETIRMIVESGVKVILIPQDTMSLDYTGLKKTKGLGYTCDKKSTRGLFVHTAIAVSEEGQTFGLLGQKIWSRDDEKFGKKEDRKRLPIKEKESNKWLEALDFANISNNLGDVRAIHLCDRESDIYEFFAKADHSDVTYVCRRVQNRLVVEASEEVVISKFLEALDVIGKFNVDVPRSSQNNREARTVSLEIKYGKTEILKPTYLGKNKDLLDKVTVTLISATEIDPPDKTEGISWQLITNDEVETLNDAILCVKRYSQRWKIETFHYTLKSGCKIEELQISNVQKLTKLVALYSIIAIHIMHLTYLARTTPDESCETILEESEWKLLYRVANKTKIVPDVPPSTLETVIMIAKLGGFLARKSDGMPGVKVIWRGLSKLNTIIQASEFIF